MLTRLLPLPLLLASTWLFAQTLDPSTYTLTNEAAAKYVKASQQLLSMPSPKVGPDGVIDLAEFKALIDSTPAAQQALSAVGLSSTEYTLFMAAALQSLMVGQMEQRGVTGTLPPGVAKRPPQANIDFMNQNRDLFLRVFRGAAAASDTAPPVPNAGAQPH